MKKIILITLCLLTIACSTLPIIGFAQSVEETTVPASSHWDGKCTVAVVLDSEITEKTDNIKIKFTQVGTFSSAGSVILSRKNDFASSIDLPPEEYKITFSSADNDYEVILEESRFKVPEAKSATLTIHAKKVQDGSFIATFFRNNTFLLILLAISSIAYYILRKRRLANTYNTANQ